MNHKRIIISFVLFASILIVIFVPTLFKTSKSEVVLGGKTFTAEVADTGFLREKGFSGHKPLLANEGMIFIFEQEGNYGFWMKDMLFPIDIVWIDKNFEIIHIEKSVLPETYPKIFYPNAPSLYVLELPAGALNTLDTKIGDGVKFIKK